jgi:hypothetical protein
VLKYLRDVIQFVDRLASYVSAVFLFSTRVELSWIKLMSCFRVKDIEDIVV